MLKAGSGTPAALGRAGDLGTEAHKELVPPVLPRTGGIRTMAQRIHALRCTFASMRLFIFLFLSALSGLSYAQPDTLYVTTKAAGTQAYAVVYDPVVPAEQYTLVGRYAFDTSRVAVRLGMKKGKPSGVYRAYYPDGRPLIFAVYGWGSLHGDWTEYNEAGRVTLKGQYRNGLREGTWAFRTEGIVGRYKEGLMHGKWKYYEGNKVARVSKYRKGKLLKGSEFFIP